MRSTARLAALHFRVGAMNELQYRVNFFVQLAQSTLSLGTGLVVLALVFGNTDELDGWTRPQLLAVMGVFTMMGGIIRTFIQPNMHRVIQDVRKGTLDYALTKPADAQVLVSVRDIQIWQLVDVALGGVVLAVAVSQQRDAIGAADAVAFVVMLATGAVMIYCFWLMLATASFWLVRMDEVQELFQGLYRAGQYPVGIYPGWLRYGLTFLVPLAFAVTVPSEAITGRLDVATLGLSLGVAVVLVALSRWCWRRGIRKYGGASA
jgi:ABC-2 type transport system permease protein